LTFQRIVLPSSLGSNHPG